MTTTILGELPCPECKHSHPLKTDGRKHTFKCHHCGMLAYYQTQDAKAWVEERLQKAKSENDASTQQSTSKPVIPCCTCHAANDDTEDYPDFTSKLLAWEDVNKITCLPKVAAANDDQQAMLINMPLTHERIQTFDIQVVFERNGQHTTLARLDYTSDVHRAEDAEEQALIAEIAKAKESEAQDSNAAPTEQEEEGKGLFEWLGDCLFGECEDESKEAAKGK